MSVSPPQRVSLSQRIQDTGSSVFRGLLRPSGYISPQKMLEVKPGQIFLALLAGSALLYHQGQEHHKPNGDRSAWFKRLVESAASYAVIDNTRGIYPLAGIGLAAYRAGQHPDLLTKIQEGIKTALVLGSGYLGVHFLGAGLSKAMDESAEYKIRRFLKQPEVRTEIAGMRQAAQPQIRRLGRKLETLSGKFDALQPLLKQRPESPEVRLLQKEILRLKAEIAEAMMQERLKRPLARLFKQTQPLEQLLMVLKTSEAAYVKISRKLNPIFGYVIGSSLLGIPLARWVNKQLEAKLPQLKKIHGPDLYDYYPKNPHPVGGSHGAGRHQAVDLPNLNAMGASGLIV